MMKLQKPLAIALTLLMVCAGAAWAGQHGMGHHDMGKHGKGYHDKHGYHGNGQKCGACPFKMLHGLDLTEAQTDQIVAIFEKYEDEHETLRQNMREARKTLREAIHSEAKTEADVRAAAQKVGDQLAELSVHRSKMYSEIRPVLTDDQVEKLQEMKTRQCERKKCHQRLNKAIQDYQDVAE
jgi:Spy/CpxP family protein refolding chaperone